MNEPVDLAKELISVATQAHDAVNAIMKHMTELAAIHAAALKALDERVVLVNGRAGANFRALEKRVDALEARLALLTPPSD